jgi:hypothetical protein
VDRVVADDPLEPLGHVDDPLHIGVGVVGAAQVLIRRQALGEARAPAHDRLRDQFRGAVAGAVVVAEHAGGVAGRRPWRHPAEGDDLGDRLPPVLLLDVADHLLAATHREVDIDIRHRLARGVEEAFEEQVVRERVEIGDRERVGDDRARGGAAARADGDAVVLGVLDEVPDDQEVGVEAHLGDHAELELEALDRLGRRRVAVAAAQAVTGEAVQHLARLLAIGGREPRQQELAEFELQLAALGNLEGGRDGLGPGGEGLGHLARALEEELVGVEGQLRLLERRLGLHAEERRVVRIVLTSQVVDVGGGDEGPAELTRRPHDALVRLVLLRDPVGLDLEVDVVGAKGPDKFVGVRPRVGGSILDQAPAEARLQATAEGDDARRVAIEQLHVHARLAPGETLEKGRRRELHEVAEPLVACGKQGEVVALDALARRRCGCAPVVDQVGL